MMCLNGGGETGIKASEMADPFIVPGFTLLRQTPKLYILI